MAKNYFEEIEGDDAFKKLFAFRPTDKIHPPKCKDCIREGRDPCDCYGSLRVNNKREHVFYCRHCYAGYALHTGASAYFSDWYCYECAKTSALISAQENANG